MSGVDLLLSPYQLAGLTLRNRVIMGSMHVGLEGGRDAAEALTTFYQTRAKAGGPGLIVTGGIAITLEGEGGANFLGFYRGKDRIIMQEVTEAVHAAGGHIAAQLFHAGRYAYPELTGQPAVAPSAIRSPIHRERPRALTDEDIHQLIHTFADRAKQAIALGFDAIEIMGSEGYLLNQFLSPVTNKRTDEWGGSLEKRMRFPLAVLEAVRKAVNPSIPVIFRMSGADLVPGSTSETETIQFAQALEVLGVDAINVGIGWHESQVPTISSQVPRAGFIHIAEKLKQHVRIPIIGSNRINDPQEANQLLEEGRCDLISMARPFLADPDILQKSAQGDFDRINTCIACNQACLDHVFMGQPASCLVNPRVGREHLLTSHPKTMGQTPEKIAVVGGGVAGMEAARTLAEIGNQVILFEAKAELGGQINYAKRVPGKREFNETLRYYRTELHRLGVPTVLNYRVSADELIKQSFKKIIIATGVSPRLPDIEGLQMGPVLTYAEAFQHPERIGERVAIIGAGGIACDLAHFLNAQQPRDITLMRRHGKMGEGLGKTTRWALIQHLREQGVHFMSELRYQRIDKQGVWIDHFGDNGEWGTECVEVDSVILAAGQESTPFDCTPFQVRGIPSILIGGAKHAGELDAKRAIYEGAQLAW
ncbi:2,4-dienoyl-CoA reductase [Pullulanibacillus camelliae]|uniref:2,4-dienoyl-CoA reductase n=1 Tax=Pullulanibacillus camelliae TaxID=1707096 RepID=A0A8J2VQM6_9BACL|nr:FAD-dependent oxidoreductase [Pullulanibacillus camelliae]GGE35519.1 2,4-dienoyl-CoA reductase [Pullulanibacillus camelliae]